MHARALWMFSGPDCWGKHDTFRRWAGRKGVRYRFHGRVNGHECGRARPFILSPLLQGERRNGGHEPIRI